MSAERKWLRDAAPNQATATEPDSNMSHIKTNTVEQRNESYLIQPMAV